MEKYLKDSKDTKVTRDGEISYITAGELLVGDLVYVAIGDIFKVDGILIEGSKLSIDESSLTGETDLVIKDTIFTDS